LPSAVSRFVSLLGLALSLSSSPSVYGLLVAVIESINRFRARVPPIVGTIGKILFVGVMLYNAFAGLFKIR
jgi:hypothetical protein